jgi:hypothetical protein
VCQNWPPTREFVASGTQAERRETGIAPGHSIGEPLHIQIVRGGLEQGHAESQGLRGSDREVRAGGRKTIYWPNPLIDGHTRASLQTAQKGESREPMAQLSSGRYQFVIW